MNATAAFVVALFVSYAATPEEAAKLAVYPAKGSHLQIERSNVTGLYASVLMRNAMMEGSLDSRADSAAALLIRLVASRIAGLTLRSRRAWHFAARQRVLRSLHVPSVLRFYVNTRRRGVLEVET